MKNSMIVLFTLFCLQGNAQVQLSLHYNETTQVYTVSIIPGQTWAAPKNMVASSQIVLKASNGSGFTPGITSLVDGLVWADNAYIENPDGAPGNTFVCIALVNGPTTKIEMSKDKELPLFSFVNAGGGCPGLIEILPNDHPMVQAVRASGLNITQHMAILGAMGNGVTGVANGSVDCSTTSDVQELTPSWMDEILISPVPADKTVTIQWTQRADSINNKHMVICDGLGREMLREKVSNGIGNHTMHVNVENWPAGMYRVRFMQENGPSTPAWNIVVVH
ncbi:MAG TPA: T9SS type A sorting domain-containing protein [Saprospiraceae bacterium]|nr:T9SS type A sorting domain-containing protein [Saprospiraceae bacterium]